MPQNVLYAILFFGGLIMLLLLIALSRVARVGRAHTRPLSGHAADPELSRRAAETLSQLIRFKTVSYGAENEHAEWAHLRDYLRKRFPYIHEAMERETVGHYSLLFKWPSPNSQGEPLLFCGHLDVVPADEGGWQHPPFAGDVSHNMVWGRGALDCKNVVTCLLECAEELIRQGFTPTRDIYFAFGHDEEVGGADGAGMLARVFAQRDMRFAMVLDEGGWLNRGVLTLRRPVAEVAVSEKGMMNVRLSAQSVGGHASQPPAHTALGLLSEAICRVEYKPYRARLTPLVTDMLKTLVPYLPYGWRFMIANRWLCKRRLLRRLKRSDLAPMVHTTMAPTMALAGRAPNVLPSSADATLNIRMLHGDDGEDVLRYLRHLMAGLDVGVEALTRQEASQVSDYKGEIFNKLTASIHKIFGETPVTPSLMPAATDARRYENFSHCVFRFCPFVLGPNERALIHAVDERVSVEGLGLAAAFYKDVIRRLAGHAWSLDEEAGEVEAGESPEDS